MREKRALEIDGNIAKVPLGIGGRDGYSIIDSDQAKLIGTHNWFITPKGYAFSSNRGRLHRVIMNAPEGVQVDHINGDKLDNRKCNLRFATHGQNTVNRKTRSKWGYKGIGKVSKGSWQAQIMHNGVVYGLGNYDSPEKAALAYNKKAIELHGEFAVLNEIPNEKNT